MNSSVGPSHQIGDPPTAKKAVVKALKPGDPGFEPYYRRCQLRHQTHKNKDGDLCQYLHCMECRADYRSECAYIEASKNRGVLINGPDFRMKCGEVLGLRCGVDRHLCVDCSGERNTPPCDDIKLILKPKLPDCLHCVNHETDLVASVHGPRLRSCMVEPCKFERRVK